MLPPVHVPPAPSCSLTVLTEMKSISQLLGRWFAETELPIFIFKGNLQPSEEQTSTKAQNLPSLIPLS